MDALCFYELNLVNHSCSRWIDKMLSLYIYILRNNWMDE
jgi:hypothetical protein